LFARHAEESQQGGTGQNNVRAWKEGTHLLEGADPGLVKAWKCHQVLVCLGVPSSLLLFVARHAEESQCSGWIRTGLGMPNLSAAQHARCHRAASTQLLLFGSGSF